MIVGEAANDREETLHDHGGKAQAELIRQQKFRTAGERQRKR